MHYIWYILWTVFYSVVTCAENSAVVSKTTYENLYKAGVEAYLENRWRDCVVLIEKSIEDYIYYRSVIVQCRKNCEKNETRMFLDEDRNSHLWNFQLIVTERALCLMKCQKLYFPSRPKTSKETDEEFENKVPYNYLQLCYFKIEEPEKAASCAYTFLIHNPEHQVMQANLQYYTSIPGIKMEKIKYLEPKDYQELFLKGAQLYTEHKFLESIEVMEASLKEYLLAEDVCRLLCEGPMPDVSKEGLLIDIANYLTYSLRCKLNCSEKLAYMYGQRHDNLFVSHYHYLQFNYYKMEKLKETCEAVASFLLFHPDDKTMTSNKQFYLKQPEVSEECFSPRKEAVEYFNRYKRESELLKHIAKLFKFDKIPQAAKSPIPPPGLTTTKTHQSDKAKFRKRDGLSLVESSKWFKKASIEPFLNENDLNGTQRVAFMNLASLEECEQLVDLAAEGGVYGDGYNGKESPHTEYEMFEGLTVARAAILAQRGILNPLSAQLFLNISEKARQAVEIFFNLDTELYFAYTHLVCRTALPDSPDARLDLSHPIHADNCVLTPSGKCLKEKPAYTWRDYSSIVYLNEDFEGGEFIFAEDKNTIQATIKPKCGLMVAFSAGEENLHGVKAVRKGRRCALAMWYTLDYEHREKERDFAESTLNELWLKRRLSSRATVSDNFEKSTLYKFTGDILSHSEHSHSEL